MEQSAGQQIRTDQHGGGEEEGPVTPAEQIAALERALREKDDIIAAQYAEIAGTRRRLEQAVAMLNDMANVKD